MTARIFGIWTLACTAALAGPTYEAEIHGAGICGDVVSHLNESRNINRAVRRSGFKVIAFRPARLTFQAATDRAMRQEAVEVARFDIDNDGRLDTIVKYETWLRNSPGDVLWVFPKATPVDIAALPTLSSEDFARMPAVEPITPWPYSDRGIWLARIAALTFEGTTYLSLRDTSFGDVKFPDRRWIIAKFTGRPMASRGYHDATDSLETVCSFRVAGRRLHPGRVLDRRHPVALVGGRGGSLPRWRIEAFGAGRPSVY